MDKQELSTRAVEIAAANLGVDAAACHISIWCPTEGDDTTAVRFITPDGQTHGPELVPPPEDDE